MSAAIVKIKQGQLKGKICEDYDGNVYYAFLGIPYAKPPLGNLRFKAPQPPESWEGLRDATEDGSPCFARDELAQKLVGSEDCLFLNVFTNVIPSNKANLKPVMVWIHGGGFLSGSNSTNFFGPDFIICEDVVVVTINYRLGVLGFLSLNDPNLGVPGNAGLKDMVMALKWVQCNIQSFNGDPNNVTIFGQSAGGAAAHYLMLSPMAKGLFHKVIAMGGCATNIWASGKTGIQEIANYCGFSGENEEEILKLLQNATKEELLKGQLKNKNLFLADVESSFLPIVEKFNHCEERFLPDKPENIIRSGNFSKVPLIMGFASREGMALDYMEKAFNVTYRTNDFEKFIPHTLNLPKNSPLSLEVANRIRNFYFGNKDPVSDETIDDYYKLQSDIFFLKDIYTCAVNHSQMADSPVYLYRFSLETDLNVLKKICQITKPGACHGDDFGYLFKSLFTPNIIPGSLEEISMRRFVKYFTTFAKHGDPNSQSSAELFSVLWEPLTKNVVNYLDINENITVGCNPEDQRMKFWESLFLLKQDNHLDI